MHHNFYQMCRNIIPLCVTLAWFVLFGCDDPTVFMQTNQLKIVSQDGQESTIEIPSPPDPAENESGGSIPPQPSKASPSASPVKPGNTIADHTVAKENVLRRIPESAIANAKKKLHIMYCGTSHSSQVVSGMKALQSYKNGDEKRFAVSFTGTAPSNTLDIHYRPVRPVDVSSAQDLSHDSVDSNGNTQYFHRTIEYLDHPDNTHINVVMWSWCSIEGHNVNRYIDNFDELIDMYSPGGSKGRTVDNAVTFVWMTGYARGEDGNDPNAAHSPYNNHRIIVSHCKANGYFCLDYWSQDTHDYETDQFYPTAQGNSPTHLLDWMEDHPNQWYPCEPAHAIGYDLLGNRRAYAAWWLWARIAGWNGRLDAN